MAFSQINLFKNNKSDYSILLPADPTRLEKDAAAALQDYFKRVTTYTLPIITESNRSNKKKYLISIGKTQMSRPYQADLASESFSIRVINKSVVFHGMGKGIIYAAYSFIENVLECRKWSANEDATCPVKDEINLPGQYYLREQPSFKYREVYFPVEDDLEYVNWHRIHRLEDLWGLWGHTFSKLVPPNEYFKEHPEYFAFFNGERRPNQLCLSNSRVLEIAAKSVENAILENPAATFWSVSPNDDPAYCECPDCKKIDNQEGGPQGSLIHFVNGIAAKFPDHHFTTLAYAYTSNSPLLIKPLSNVTIFLSSIDVNRTQAISIDKSAAIFRKQMQNWKSKTKNIFIWDYYTQFTNYLTPFPNIYTLNKNLQYFKDMGVKGVFAQGSGETYSDMAELKAYLLSKMLWDPTLDTDSLMDEFLSGYYGKAAPSVKEYVSRTTENVQSEDLSIYGNPVNNHMGYLSLVNMESYSMIMDNAERLVEGDKILEHRILRLRLTQEYTYLQQCRFYGIEKHGIFDMDEGGIWKIKEGLSERIRRFTSACGDNGITELSEGGLSPEQYQAEWDSLLSKGVKNNLALHASIKDTSHPYVKDFPAKGWRTLVDGNPGYNDYSYNWLCFYNVPMELTIDLKENKRINTVSMNFLENPRHWIFGPQSVEIQVSEDGIEYSDIGAINSKNLETYVIDRKFFIFKDIKRKTRFIKIKAIPLSALPDWRYHKTKKPMIACDEIWVD